MKSQRMKVQIEKEAELNLIDEIMDELWCDDDENKNKNEGHMDLAEEVTIEEIRDCMPNLS